MKPALAPTLWGPLHCPSTHHPLTCQWLLTGRNTCNSFPEDFDRSIWPQTRSAGAPKSSHRPITELSLSAPQREHSTLCPKDPKTDSSPIAPSSNLFRKKNFLCLPVLLHHFSTFPNKCAAFTSASGAASGKCSQRHKPTCDTCSHLPRCTPSESGPRLYTVLVSCCCSNKLS